MLRTGLYGGAWTNNKVNEKFKIRIIVNKCVAKESQKNHISTTRKKKMNIIFGFLRKFYIDLDVSDLGHNFATSTPKIRDFSLSVCSTITGRVNFTKCSGMQCPCPYPTNYIYFITKHNEIC